MWFIYFHCFFFLLLFFPFHYPSLVFIPIIRHNSFDFVYYWRYYHDKISKHCRDFVFIIISRRLWTFCFGHQLWSFLIRCVFQSVFISLFDVPKYILLRSILGILELNIFHCHNHWFYVWSAIGVYLNDYQTMSLKPIFAFRPGAIYLKDSMIVDWMICVRMRLHYSRPFSNFFYPIYKDTVLDNNAYDWKVELFMLSRYYYGIWPLYYLGVQPKLWLLTRLDCRVINHSHNSNMLEMDLDIFASW